MKGYTLIEVLVAVSISTVLLVAVVQFVGNSFPVYRSTFLQTSADELAQLQMKRIAEEVREARTSDAGAYPIVQATPYKIIFYANVDADASVERVRYELVGTTLVKGIINPSAPPTVVYNVSQEQVSTIARSIYNGTTPIFTYYGSDYPSNTNPLILE
jgi:prepilin-type N-terminal cleavage/methylation domain-containing protein